MTQKSDTIFSTKVDLRNRENMISFLDGHPKYNHIFAHNVKLRNLQIPAALRDTAEAIVSDPDSPFWSEPFVQTTARNHAATELRYNSTNIPPVSFSFEGRSNGHIVMEYTRKGSGNTSYYSALNATDLATLDTSEIRDIAKDVMFFDRIIDKYRDYFLTFCKVTQMESISTESKTATDKQTRKPKLG